MKIKEIVAHGGGRPSRPPHRSATVKLPLALQLLGRDVDLNKLVSQRMNEALHKSLDIAISRFEDGDITGIMVSYSLHFSSLQFSDQEDAGNFISLCPST